MDVVCCAIVFMPLSAIVGAGIGRSLRNRPIEGALFGLMPLIGWAFVPLLADYRRICLQCKSAVVGQIDRCTRCGALVPPRFPDLPQPMKFEGPVRGWIILSFALPITLLTILSSAQAMSFTGNPAPAIILFLAIALLGLAFLLKRHPLS